MSETFIPRSERINSSKTPKRQVEKKTRTKMKTKVKKKRDFWSFLFTHILRKEAVDSFINSRYVKKKKKVEEKALKKQKRRRKGIKITLIQVITLLFCLCVIAVPFLLKLRFF